MCERNTNKNVNADAEFIWIFLLEVNERLAQLNVNQNCIHRINWNCSYGTAASDDIMLFCLLHWINSDKFIF